MKLMYLFFIASILCFCSKSEKQILPSSSEIVKSSVVENDNIVSKKILKLHEKNIFQLSTYDDPQFETQISAHRKNLQQLSEKKVFDLISQKLLLKLDQKFQIYFSERSELQLLSYAQGDLFKDGRKDAVFFVYNKSKHRGIFLLYNDEEGQYFELFKDLKVENGLEDAGCNYGSFGTLDYQFAEELIDQEIYLTKNSDLYIEDIFVKITDLQKDENFILKDGCFAEDYAKGALSKSLCISTNSVYNNWECLQYDKANNTFVIFYGQAFAD